MQNSLSQCQIPQNSTEFEGEDIKFILIAKDVLPSHTPTGPSSDKN